MKKLLLLILLAAACYLGWRYFQPPEAPPPAPVVEAPRREIPFHLRLKVQHLIQKYEEVLIGQGAGPVPARTRDEFTREVASIKRDLQRLKLYDPASLHAFCLQAASEIDTNGDGNPDYAPDQANHLVTGILTIAGN